MLCLSFQNVLDLIALLKSDTDRQNDCVPWETDWVMLICEFKVVATLGTQLSHESRSLGHQLMQ